MADAAPPAVFQDRARSLYAGAKGTQAPVGEVVRSLIRKGRQVVRQESSRWQENRAFYDGSQWLKASVGSGQINQINRLAALPTGWPSYNTYNQLRKNVKARTALLMRERPAFDIDAEDNDRDSVEAAGYAKKLVRAKWGPEGWDIDGARYRMVKYGDIDGISILCVEWDPDKAESTEQMMATRLDGTPITDRAEYEAMKAQDPNAQSLWRVVRQSRPIGDVSFRVVLPAAMSWDPFAHSRSEDANWCAESRVRPRAEVERRMGRSFKDVVEESNKLLSEGGNQVRYEDIALSDGAGKSMISETDGVVVHYFYARPCPDFPKGARIEILDRAPTTPLRAEPWDDELPYFVYATDESPEHFLRSKGVVDTLKPIQRDYNQARRDLSIWRFKMANSPVMIPVGSLRGQSFYDEKGYIELHMAAGQPFQYSTPAEPSVTIANDLAQLRQEMEDVSGVSAAARGFSAPNSPESSAGISQQIQQTEQNLSEAEAHLKRVLEKAISRALRLVEQNYTEARAVTGVGVDDANEFRSFRGAMIRGANRFRITSSMMAKSKAARLAAVKELAPIIGGDGLQPYIADLIDGDTSRLERDIDRWRKHQRDEINDMLTLVTNQQAQQVNKNFDSDKQAFSQAFNEAAAQASQMPPSIGPDGAPAPAADPTQILGQAGITPPNLTQMLQAAGLDVPMVEGEDDNHFIEIDECNVFRTGDAYKRTHPMFKQMLREHMQAHKAGMRQQTQAMARQSPMGQQQGSSPAEKGTPSPPKSAPTPPGG